VVLVVGILDAVDMIFVVILLVLELVSSPLDYPVILYILAVVIIPIVVIPLLIEIFLLVGLMEISAELKPGDVLLPVMDPVVGTLGCVLILNRQTEFYKFLINH
jgi:hypothetical protein